MNLTLAQSASAPRRARAVQLLATVQDRLIVFSLHSSQARLPRSRADRAQVQSIGLWHQQLTSCDAQITFSVTGRARMEPVGEGAVEEARAAALSSKGLSD